MNAFSGYWRCFFPQNGSSARIPADARDSAGKTALIPEPSGFWLSPGHFQHGLWQTCSLKRKLGGSLSDLLKVFCREFHNGSARGFLPS